jgi:hypothetical protein
VATISKNLKLTDFLDKRFSHLSLEPGELLWAYYPGVNRPVSGYVHPGLCPLLRGLPAPLVTIRGISLSAATGAMRQLAIAIRYAVIVLLNKTIVNKESRIFTAITIPTIKNDSYGNFNRCPFFIGWTVLLTV